MLYTPSTEQNSTAVCPASLAPRPLQVCGAPAPTHRRQHGGLVAVASDRIAEHGVVGRVLLLLLKLVSLAAGHVGTCDKGARGEGERGIFDISSRTSRMRT